MISRAYTLVTVASFHNSPYAAIAQVTVIAKAEWAWAARLRCRNDWGPGRCGSETALGCTGQQVFTKFFLKISPQNIFCKFFTTSHYQILILLYSLYSAKLHAVLPVEKHETWKINAPA